MDRVYLALLLMTLIFSTHMPVLAQTFSGDLDLPSDYKTWPHIKINTCETNSKSLVTYLYGKFDADSKEVSVITLTSIDNKLVLVIYTGGSEAGARWGFEYYPSLTGPTKYDPFNSREERERAKTLFNRQVENLLGMTTDEVSDFFMKSCTPVYYQINDFVLKILKDKQ